MRALRPGRTRHPLAAVALRARRGGVGRRSHAHGPRSGVARCHPGARLSPRPHNRLLDVASDPMPFWRPGEPGGNGRSGYQAATVCRRGHVESRYHESEPTHLSRCPDCGADVLSRCRQCGLRIRGDYYSRSYRVQAHPVPAFCDGCGAAHPWATRAQRLYELQNILDQEDVDDVDRSWINEQMDRLRPDDGSISEKQEREIWTGVKNRAPGLFGAAGKAVLSGVVSAGVRATLGL